MLHILMVEPNREDGRIYRRVLVSNGFSLRSVESAREAAEAISAEDFDLVMTELELPGEDSEEFIRAIRRPAAGIAILVVTGRDSIEDMKTAFQAGVDDYMVKPVNLEEMILRIRALLRRSGQLSGERQVLGRTVVDYSSMTVETPEGTVMLPQKEFQLLYRLVSFPGRAFTRQQLKDEIWGLESNSDMHTVEVHVARLREKFKQNPDFEIVTVRGVGYKAVSWTKKEEEKPNIENE